MAGVFSSSLSAPRSHRRNLLRQSLYSPLSSSLAGRVSLPDGRVVSLPGGPSCLLLQVGQHLNRFIESESVRDFEVRQCTSGNQQITMPCKLSCPQVSPRIEQMADSLVSRMRNSTGNPNPYLFEKGMVGLSFCDFVGTREEKARMAENRQKEWPQALQEWFPSMAARLAKTQRRSMPS